MHLTLTVSVLSHKILRLKYVQIYQAYTYTQHSR
jgi:hypothetical protein